MSRGRLAGAALALSAGAALAAAPALTGDDGVYSPSGWATLHQGPANRRHQPVALPPRYREWHALAGATVLTAPVVGPAGELYVTTGQGEGHANLHSFTLDGAPRWESAPWSGARGVDGCAVLSSPIVDVAGDVYLSDCDQVFAFRADGSQKWVVALPPPPADSPFRGSGLSVNAFTTAVFSRDGDVVGVTNFGDVVVLDRASGAAKAEPFQLPGLVAARSEAHRLPPSLFGDGMLDPRLRDWAWQLLFGGSMRSANTPAVAASGRIFVAATSQEPGLGALYGLDLVPQTDARLAVRVAFASEMGPGSGSSPTLSPDERQVYVSDESGLVYAFDTATGTRLWTAPSTATAAAFAIGGDGMLVALTVDPALTALDADGRTLWHSDLSALVASEGLPHSFWLGAPVAVGTGNPTLVEGEVLVPVLFGYWLGPARWRLTVPVRSALVAVDAKSGRGLRRVVALRDDSSGISAVLPDGTLMESLGGAVTSATSSLHGPMRWLLPGALEPMPPVGGLEVFRPLR